MKRPRKIIIMPVLNGYCVQADCQTIVFNSRESLILALGSYYANPGDVEKEYLKDAVNPMSEEPIPCNPCEERVIANPSIGGITGLLQDSQAYAQECNRIAADRERVR